MVIWEVRSLLGKPSTLWVCGKGLLFSLTRLACYANEAESEGLCSRWEIFLFCLSDFLWGEMPALLWQGC